MGYSMWPILSGALNLYGWYLAVVCLFLIEDDPVHSRWERFKMWASLPFVIPGVVCLALSGPIVLPLVALTRFVYDQIVKKPELLPAPEAPPALDVTPSTLQVEFALRMEARRSSEAIDLIEVPVPKELRCTFCGSAQEAPEAACVDCRAPYHSLCALEAEMKCGRYGCKGIVRPAHHARQ